MSTGGDAARRAASVSLDAGSGVVRVDWGSCPRIDETLAHDAMLAVDDLTDGRPCVVYVDMTGVGSVTRAGRVEFARPCTVTRLALVGRSPVDRLIATSTLGVTAHATPMRFFTVEQDAMDWLLDRPAPDADPTVDPPLRR